MSSFMDQARIGKSDNATAMSNKGLGHGVLLELFKKCIIRQI